MANTVLLIGQEVATVGIEDRELAEFDTASSDSAFGELADSEPEDGEDSETFAANGETNFADVSEIDAHEGEVLWDRRRVLIPIDSSDSTTLVGMQLLEGFALMMQVRQDGPALIKDHDSNGTGRCPSS